MDLKQILDHLTQVVDRYKQGINELALLELPSESFNKLALDLAMLTSQEFKQLVFILEQEHLGTHDYSSLIDILEKAKLYSDIDIPSFIQ